MTLPLFLSTMYPPWDFRRSPTDRSVTPRYSASCFFVGGSPKLQDPMASYSSLALLRRSRFALAFRRSEARCQGGADSSGSTSESMPLSSFRWMG